jgi:hypothetical protein
MSCVQFYAVKKDFIQLFAWLSQEEEIAFIAPDGPGRWKAVSHYGFQGDRVYSLWHVPSGPLPFLRADDVDAEDYVPDPWKGWKEEVEGNKEFNPTFGSAAVGIIMLSASSKSHRDRPQAGHFMPAIGLSAFSWIGNHYSAIGLPALESTEKVWNKIKRWLKKEGLRIPRKGTIDGPKPEIWALPHALDKIKKSYPRNWEITV